MTATWSSRVGTDPGDFVGLFQTGSPWERLLVAPALLAVAVWMVVTRTYADAGPVLNVIGI